jgi:DNA-binding SARP family transcriptional activator
MPSEGSGTSVLALAGLVLGAAAVGSALWWLGGPPHVPSAWPDWERINQIMTGSHVPYADVIDVAKGIGWLALAYLAVTLVLRVSGQAFVRLTDGAAWARAGLRLSDAVTIPVVSRVVDGALAGTLVLAVWFRAGPTTEVAASVGSSFVAVAAPAGPVPTLEWADAASAEPANEDVIRAGPGGRSVAYTVVPGDTLWAISRRFYGDGTLYTSIFRANEGRVMTSGEAFTNPRLIRPGWVLDVPLPGYNVWDAGDHVMYRVRPGDSLWRIAESLLDDALRWTEIWELNQERDMGRGRRFTDPNLILPGWVLELPVGARVAEQTPLPDSAEEPPPPLPSPTAEPPVESEGEGEVREPTATVEGEPDPTVAPVQEPSRDGGGAIDWPTPSVMPVLATAAGLAAAGGVAIIVRHLARRRGEQALAGAHGRAKAAVRGDVGRVVLAARALMRALSERGFDDLRLVLARESERYLEFTLECAPGDAEPVVAARYELGRRLACGVDGAVARPTRIRLKLSRFQRLAGLLVDETADEEPLLLVPAGAADNGVYYLNLAAAGSAIVVGSPHEAGKILSAWLATLAALYPPERVAFLAARGLNSLVGDATSLPHFAIPAQDGDERSVEELAAELEEAIVARDDAMATASRAAIVALASLSGEWSAEVERLETALHRGPEHGISIVCIAEEADGAERLGAFGTRLAFGPFGDGSAGPDELALSLRGDAALALKPVEVRSEVLRPLMRREGPAEYEQAHPGAAQPVDDGEEVTTEERWEDALPTAEEQITPDDVPGDVEEDGDGASGAVSLEPAEEAVAEPREAEMVARRRGETPATRQSPLLLSEEEAPDGHAATAGGPSFTVRCFGSFQVETDTGEVTGWTIQKAREMLAYLIARGGTPALRDEVAEALWPGGDRAQVDHLLYNATYYLRRALKSAAPTTDVQPLAVSAQRYQLRSAMFRVDVDAFDAHLRRAESLDGPEGLVEYERALALYQGDFVGNEPYDWAEPYRREYQRRFVDAAHRAAKLAVDCRDTAKAVEFYQGIVAHDPIDEEAARGVMHCYAKLGDVNGVRKVYKVLCESLPRELEDDKAEPLPETTALFRELTA